MLTLLDVIEYSNLTEEEIAAIAETEELVVLSVAEQYECSGV